MKPYLVSKTFDLARLCDSNGRALFDKNNLALYVQTATSSIPTSNGIGVLGDAISCRVRYELNGADELTMTYPVTGELFDQIELRALVIADVGRRGNQPYRIYRITKPINGIVTIYARHLVYDLSGIVVEPFTAGGIVSALSGMKSHSMTANPFTFATTRGTNVPFSVKRPDSVWNLLGGQEGSLLDVYGGEYTFDRYRVSLENRVGTDNGVSVVYGVNMTDLQQDADCADCYTGVVAYWQTEGDEDGSEADLIYTPVISAAGTYGYVKILSVDMSDRWETKPTMAQLKAAASKYITDNQIGIPRVSWKIGFVPLDTTEEYKDIAALERVSMGDTVTVKFAKLGVDATSRVRAIEWDVLLERYVTVELGSVRDNIADTIARQTEELAKVPTAKQMRDLATKISTTLTKTILGAKGGSIRFLDTDGDGDEDTLYVADNKDPSLARKIWRWNYEGWAASQNGFNGPFVLGATLNDGLLASFVTAANLTAGRIRSQDGTTFDLDLDNGVLTMNGYASKAELATSGGTVINGGNITTGTMTANRIRGGTLKLGGLNDENGVLDVYNADGVRCGRLNKDGLYVGGGSVGELNTSMQADGLAVRLRRAGSNTPLCSVSYRPLNGKIYGLLSLFDESYGLPGVQVCADGSIYANELSLSTVKLNSAPGKIIINPNGSSQDNIVLDGSAKKISLNPGSAVYDSVVIDGANRKITLNASQTHDAVSLEIVNYGGKITLRNGAGDSTITLDGGTGRVDCKSLYINGVQVTP